MMIHDGSLQMESVNLGVREIDRITRDMKFSNDAYRNILASRSGNSVAQVGRWCRRETYFSAQEALRHGFIDAIL